MSQILNVLIVDNHPSAVEGYERCIEMASANIEGVEFNINKAYDCDSANLKIEEAKNGMPLDLVLLDISLPPSTDHTLLSGEDLGIKLMQVFKDVKLIVLTSCTNNHKLCNIFKTLNPDGFLIKMDFFCKDIVVAIIDVINDTPHYSKTIKRLMRRHMSNELLLDQKDREILYHLSKGTRMKDLPEMVDLSIGGIEKRKRHLRDLFDTPKKDDRALIECAKEKGYI